MVHLHYKCWGNTAELFTLQQLVPSALCILLISAVLDIMVAQFCRCRDTRIQLSTARRQKSTRNTYGEYNGLTFTGTV